MKKYTFFLVCSLFMKGLIAQTINYDYDSLGRLVQVIYPDSAIIKYAYDAAGNRISKAVIQSTIIRSCPQSNITFFSGSTDNTKTYQWQVDAGSGFSNVNNGSIYLGAVSNTLTVNNAPTNLYGYKYRCVISNSIGSTVSTPVTLKYQIKWTGTVDSLWTNTGNWSCGIIPDANTDVIINSVVPYLPVINANASCRSFTANPGVIIKMKPGFNLNVSGKNY